ncbi:heme exporter protein CcmD [Niveibacterium sp.]|uniref:heme exporter protein CcmD n=1 Tax=Niveibacterium sp. TaxID=2017444 RepID=UPI0035AE01D9
MNWNSPAEFFAMGGYGLYVWGSVIACVVGLVGELWLLRQRRNAILQSLRRERRAKAIEAEGNTA